MLTQFKYSKIKHNFRILFTVTVLTGGIIGYKSRSDFDGTESYQTYKISGISHQFTPFEMEFDFQEPSHCFEVPGGCTKDALTTNGDFLTQVKFTFYFNNHKSTPK